MDLKLLSEVETPCYIVDENLLIKNLEILDYVQKNSGAEILLAQKGFSMFYFYPLIAKYLKGSCASSLFEARLGFEYMKGRECHIFSPAYKESEFNEILKYADHIVFNSLSDYEKFFPLILKSGKDIEVGLRINPEYSEIETEIYNPCSKNSRLGIKIKDLKEIPSGVSGLHFHTMCEQNSDVLKRTLKVVEQKFSKFFKNLKWINFGGGHHITREDYDREELIKIIKDFKKRYPLKVYLEPGEAVALNTGYLVAQVLSVVKNSCDVAIIDASAACHMPDVLEMPYTPKVLNSSDKGKFEYILAGPTCLAGDVVGRYRFDKKLDAGDKIIFCDMAHYTMVKNNTFNGFNLPDIDVIDKNGKLITVKKFGYEDFKNRLS